MNRIFKAITFLVFAICASVSVNAADSINVIINGEPMYSDVPAQIIEGRTMVPMRGVFEALDADVNWNGETKTITACKNETVIKMTIGEMSFYKNDVSVSLDVPAQIIDGRTLVPVRAVSESLGCNVEWDNASKTVIITDSSKQGKTYRFRNESLLAEHFEKHGEEFGYSSAAEYEAAAGKVINDPRALHKTEKEDGDDVYYIEETNEFVVVSKDGFIRTYFKPDSGIKYYEKQ
ncbi:MAG: hypothetical protein IJL89_03260 [Firmicutes bacterium]|nr:hypothetical protein [Bacillota bacterium]